MDQAAAIKMAQAYAGRWGVPWGRVLSVEAKREGWRRNVRGYSIEVEAGDRPASISIWIHDGNIHRFEFIPGDSGTPLLPLWAAFPSFCSVTIGWRMSFGESYRYHWHEWYGRLGQAERVEYQRRFPVPVDEEGGWADF